MDALAPLILLATVLWVALPIPIAMQVAFLLLLNLGPFLWLRTKWRAG
jgi:hypothetical protein